MNQTSAAPNEKRDTSQKDLLTKKSGSVLANVRWSFVVLAIGVLILGVLIISFPTAIPYSGAIAGGLLTVSLAFGVGEIATAYYRREQAKEICEENLREEAVEAERKTAETLRANVLAQSAPKGSAFLPFTTRSLLEMCWGMTMNLSHETQQQELGKTLIQSSNSAFDKKKTDAANTDFLENLKMTFYCSVRNIGFIRASHVQYLDFNADRLTRRRQSLEQAADFASFSGSGLFTKIGSFLGVGSVFELVSKMNLPQIYIPIFAVGGVAGAFLTTFLVKIYVQLTDDSWEKKIWKKQSDYWKTEFKPDVTEELLHLYNAIKCLRTKFFPNADDELLSLKESEVKDFIRMNILPPDDLQWPPRTVAPTTDTTATTASDKQKKK